MRTPDIESVIVSTIPHSAQSGWVPLNGVGKSRASPTLANECMFTGFSARNCLQKVNNVRQYGNIGKCRKNLVSQKKKLWRSRWFPGGRSNLARSIKNWMKLLLKNFGKPQAKYCLLMPAVVSRSDSNSWPLHISSESPVRQTSAGPVR